MTTNIPTNRSGQDGKTIYATEELINSLAPYEQSLEAYKKGLNEDVEYYWYNHSAWSKEKPLGIMTKEDAFDRQSKGIAFIDFDDTIPAFTKEQITTLNH